MMRIQKKDCKTIISIILTTLFGILLIFGNPQLSSAGDVNIAEFLASQMEAGYFLIPPFVIWVLKPFVSLFPTVNWWVCFSLLIMLLSLYILTRQLQEVIDGIYGIAVAVMVSCFIWILVYEDGINFTANTALAALSGFLLLHTARKEDSGINRLIHCFVGMLFVCLAGVLRWEMLLLITPFCVMAFVFRWLFAEGAGKNWAAFLLLLFLVSVGGTWGADKLCQKIDPYYAESETANDLRQDIYDYADRYPSWEEGKEEYEAAGISQSWYNMVMNCYTSDITYFNSSTLQKMLEFRHESSATIEQYIQMLKEKPMVWGNLLLLLMVLLVIFGVRRCILPIMGGIFGFVVCSLYFVHSGRFAWRVTGGLVLAAVVVITVMPAAYEARIPGRVQEINGDAGKSRRKYIAALLFSALALVATIGHALKSEQFRIPNAGILHENEASDLAYIDEHPETMYFMDNDYYYAYSLWTGKNEHTLSNFYTNVSNFILGYRKELAQQGVNNIVADMLVRSDIYTIYNDTWNGYLEEYYDPCVSAGIMQENEETGTQFIRYSLPITEVAEGFSGTGLEDPVLSLVSDTGKSYKILKISATISGETMQDYILNVQDPATGNVYSYPLAFGQDSISGQILLKDGSWSFGSASISCLGKGEDGVYYKLMDLSGEPVGFE